MTREQGECGRGTHGGMLGGAMAGIIAGAAAGAATFFVLVGLRDIPEPIQAEPAREARLADDMERLFSDVAESARAAVVSIGTYQDGKGAANLDEAAASSPNGQTIGSGFIIDPRGYILTNHHLVEEATRVSVRLHDGREREARVVKTDSASDTALLKIEGEGLRSLPMGDCRTLRVGQWVLAVGNPFGLTETVSAGIVSALKRSDLRILPFESFIQTDAAINPGNSGGPLLNLRGEAVGICTAMYSNSSGSYQGIGFAVPIDLANALATRWIEGRNECFLGVEPSRVDEDMARYFGLEKPRGAFLATVNPGGPGAMAGLRAKDLLVSFGDTDILDENHLRVLVARARAGEPIEIGVLRPEGRQIVKVTLEEKEGWKTTADSALSPEAPRTRLLGITVTPLNARIADRLNLQADLHGMVIMEVQPGSPAAHKGLDLGDVIAEANGLPVRGLDDLKKAVEGPGEVVLLGVARGTHELRYFFLAR
jgi:serine protease Do